MQVQTFLAASLAFAACTPASDTFVCISSDQCVVAADAGRCEASGGCSFVDATCATGWRLVSPGAGSLSGQCIPGITGVGAADAGPWPVSAAPANARGQDPTFDLVFSDGSGVSALKGGGVLINSEVNGVQSCWLFFDRTQGTLSLADDNLAQWSSLAPGTVGQLSNSQCAVDGRLTSVVTSGDFLRLTVSVRFSASFSGTRSLYLYAADTAGQTSPYVLMGAWAP
jgi:hypothetical protein